MFLTKDEWRHPNRFVQKIASPAVAWCCISLGIIRAILLAEIRHKTEEGSLSEWIMLPQIDALADYLAKAAEQLGEVHVLIPPTCENGESWTLERVVSLRRWATKSHLGVEYQTEGGDWHLPTARPIEAHIICAWSIDGSSWAKAD
jgi:hypothetical protein